MRPRSRLLALTFCGVLAVIPALMLVGALPGLGAATRAIAQPSSEEPTPQTDASVPASDVTMIGATPLEAPGTNETWGVGREGSKTVVVRYRAEEGWTLGAQLQGANSEPLAGFTLDKSPLAGQLTPRGTGVVVGAVEGRAVVLMREPGGAGAFRETAPVPTEGEPLKAGEEALLKKGEMLFEQGGKRAPLIAPLDEEHGAGALIVPVREGVGVEDQVLHVNWNGHESKWTSEPIDIPEASSTDFRVLAIGAAGPSGAWLLGQLSSKASYPAGAVALFRRVEEEGKWRWKPVTLTAGSSEAEKLALTAPVQESKYEPFTVHGTGRPPNVTAQILTVTSEGVWIDGERTDVPAESPASTTLFFKPEGALTGKVERSWCETPLEAAPRCEGELPDALPTGPSRSVAWAKSGTRFGERVISGLSEGVSLRLQGESFTRVLALGAKEEGPEQVPGAAYGAAFTNASEGWLGANVMPVHLTLHRVPSDVTPWPIPFRHPLFAITPQPGALVGSLSSEALAVGDLGAVARFKPGEGWLPETLFGPGERVETPRLRAVAWPTKNRAFAVGDEGEMWLWRGETGLWEHDPATPVNFRGDLLGIAFDPSDPAVGYAVGSSAIAGTGGVLLRYGKTWTQETALPAQVQDASFTSIAFAGSEAIVAYRTRSSIFTNTEVGGLLVNDGAGWQLDGEAAAAMGAEVPVAVAGLPDGGAAFVTGGSAGHVYEREPAGSSWQPTPVPLPAGDAGSLALFREGDALRAIVSGGGAGTASEAQSPPPGFPPNFLPPLSPAGIGPQSDTVLRQTASGWSDETHELNPAGAQPGNYVSDDLPYRPDPTLAVLVDATGSQGWTVGGSVDSQQGGRLETASVERYNANPGNESLTPLGEGSSQVPLKEEATFAIGGNAQCAAPCADRSLAGIGPQVWLSSALALAKGIGVRAFLYTGPGVTRGEVAGPRAQVIPFERELAEYSSILAGSPLPAYAAISPYELDARPESEGTEADFERAFLGFPAPFGRGAAAAELAEAPGGSDPEGGEHKRKLCAEKVACEAAYYAIDSQGAYGTVRVIVLDDSGDVEPVQLEWLRTQLASAQESEQPAIVVGNADLNRQIRSGDAQAAEVARVLLAGGHCAKEQAEGPGASCPSASAYFYDAPEEDVTEPLNVGEESIPTFGSGTLGYVEVIKESEGDFHGASGFMLAQVNVRARNPSNNRAPVSARLIPVIGELALEAKDGILLRRSEPALFDGLARRPRAGGRSLKSDEEPEGDPYIPIPENCVGAACAKGLFPEYTFSSSDGEVGQFVTPNLASPDPHAVLQGADGKPIPDSQSGLFCAYNPGTTTVTISAGGLSSSLTVTVQPGSVREPCGTVPLKNLPAHPQTLPVPTPPPPAPAPAPAGPAPATAPPALLLPPPPFLPSVPPRQAPPATPPFIPLTALAAPLIPFVPPPVPTPARPTPPSGTSAVTSPIEVAEHEDEEESATESVSNQAVAYRAPDHEPAPAYLLGLLVLAAFAGVSIRRPRGGRREARIAPATISSARAQRRISSGMNRRGR